ncbi:hypothetical protein HELRODRAFT_167659 [Helobdella robusta]|uniref:Uncharacterized protein n=1 Tax=Helobdella robusta TaxID=6412 RepID=T1EZM8_HELRO|nr:hypothetical protein HELRODRAFT_167659 [Helobdella robusta]ESO09846.1 hypothetical protein HELRODRAFT_167659 [Helobdella robusta]
MAASATTTHSTKIKSPPATRDARKSFSGEIFPGRRQSVERAVDAFISNSSSNNNNVNSHHNYYNYFNNSGTVMHRLGVPAADLTKLRRASLQTESPGRSVTSSSYNNYNNLDHNDSCYNSNSNIIKIVTPFSSSRGTSPTGSVGTAAAKCYKKCALGSSDLSCIRSEDITIKYHSRIVHSTSNF